MSDAEALWAAVRAAPDDDLPKLVLADYLEEKGDEAAGYALRWCVAHGRWPHHTGDGPRGWAWANGVASHVPKPHTKGYRRAILPTVFFVAHGRVTVGQYAVRLTDSWRFPSDVEALRRLGEVLREVRRLAGLAPEAAAVGVPTPSGKKTKQRKTPVVAIKLGSGRAETSGRIAARNTRVGKWRKSFEVGLGRTWVAEYTFGPPATVAQLKAVERGLGRKLPAEVRTLLTEFNGVWRPYEDMEDSPEKEVVYFSTDGMLRDVPDYLRNWGAPPTTPTGVELRKVVFVGQVNGFADLYGVCLEGMGEFEAGAVVKLDHETGELEEAFGNLQEYVEDGPK